MSILRSFTGFQHCFTRIFGKLDIDYLIYTFVIDQGFVIDNLPLFASCRPCILTLEFGLAFWIAF